MGDDIVADVPIRYYSRDIGLQRDRKFVKLRLKYGYWAIAIYEILLDLIYADKGYYIEYNDNTKESVIFDIMTDLQGKYQPSAETVEEIITGLVESGLFSVCHFNLGYLTSHRLQLFFYKYTVERKNVEVDQKIWFLTETEMTAISKRSSILTFLQSRSNLNVNQPISIENQSILPIKEIKEKESKVNENKEDDKAVVTVFKFYMQNINPTPTATEIETLKYWIDNGFEEQLLIECINVAVKSNARNLRYVEGILKNLDNKGIKTLECFKNSEKIRSEEQTAKKEQKKNGTKFNNFEQRDYSEKSEELKGLCQKMLDDYLND